jgi:membrane protein DedA with SNARE-associated domain
VIAAPRHLPLLIAAATAITLAGLVGTALAPTLLTYHPLWLIVLSPIDRHLLLAASVTPLLPFLLVAAARRTLTCVVCYGFGHAYGEEGVAWVQARYPRTGNASGTLRRLVQRAGPVVLLFSPWPMVFGALAGAARMRVFVFLPLAALGQLVWVRITYRVGGALGAWIAPVLTFMREHVVATTLACVLMVVAYAWQQRRERRIAALPTPSEPPPPPTLAQPSSPEDS